MVIGQRGNRYNGYMKKFFMIPRSERIFILLSLTLGASFLTYVLLPEEIDRTPLEALAWVANVFVVILSIYSLMRLFYYFFSRGKKLTPKKVKKAFSEWSLVDGYQQFLGEVRTVGKYLIYFNIIAYKHIISSYNHFSRTVINGNKYRDINNFIDSMSKDQKTKHVFFTSVEKLDDLTIYHGVSRVKMHRSDLRHMEEVCSRGNIKQSVSANFDDDSCQSFKVVVGNGVS